MKSLQMWFFGFVILCGIVLCASLFGNRNSDAKPVATEPTTVPVSTPKVSPPVDNTAKIAACVQQANNTYTQNWANVCETNYNNCMSSGVISQTQCYQWWGGMCALGNATAAQYSLDLQRNKLDCYREY